MKNTYEKLFDEFLIITDFQLLKHKDGAFSLKDRQLANLANIEGDRFTSGVGNFRQTRYLYPRLSYQGHRRCS